MYLLCCALFRCIMHTYHCLSKAESCVFCIAVLVLFVLLHHAGSQHYLHHHCKTISNIKLNIYSAKDLSLLKKTIVVQILKEIQ